MRLASSKLLALSLVSGTSALLYETVWLRWFRLLFGNTAYAASATLCAFFAGLALGALLFGRWAGRTRRPLEVYAGIEAAAAITALIVPLAVTAYDPIYASLYQRFADERTTFVAVKFSLALLAVLPTATLLGGTLPMLAAAFVSDARDLGRLGTRLYAVNTLGAALGSAAGSLWLPEVIGVQGTYAVAIAFSASVAVAAFALRRQVGPPAPDLAAPAPSATKAPSGLLTIAFVSGFGVLAFEVLLVHSVSQSVISSVYSFGAVLILVLLTLAVGAGLVSATTRFVPARPLLGWALAAEALVLLVVPVAVVLLTDGLRIQVRPSFGNGLALAAGFGGPALLIASLVLPLTFRLAEGGAVGPRIGGLLAANTLGGIAGSVTASFVLLDQLGLWASIAVLGGIYAVTSFLALGSARSLAARAAVVAAGAAAVFLTGANPLRLPVVAHRDNLSVLAIEEGAHGVVSVTESPTLGLGLRVNNHYVLGYSFSQRRQERMGHLPLLLHGDPKSALYVGSATGGSAAAAVLHPLEQIVLVELVPEVQELAARYFDAASRGVFRDPRTRRVIEDGRNHLRAAPEAYDVVMADLFIPWRSGAGAMYSRDHFQTVKEHLNPRGVFLQWLPIYQLGEEQFRVIAATFLDVFPDATLWRGDFWAHQPTVALVGYKDAAPSVDRIHGAVRRLKHAGVDDRWITDARGLWMLYLGPLAVAGEDLATVDLNTDSWPIFEFMAGRTAPEAKTAFRERTWLELTTAIVDRADTADPVYPGRPSSGPRAGLAVVRACMLVKAGGPAKLPEARRLVREHVPWELLQPPDTSAGEVWLAPAQP